MAKRSLSDMHPEDIKAAVRKKGWTLSEASLAYGVPECAARQALRRPYFSGEFVISEILSLSPRQIWPSRFDAQGNRLPQVRCNGKPIQFPAKRHCQKQEAA